MSAIDANQAINQGLELPKFVKQAKTVYEKSDAFVATASSIVSGVDAFVTKVPTKVTNAVGALSFYSGINAAFAAPSMVCNISKAVRATNVVDRVKSVFRAMLDGGAIWGAVNAVVSGLKSVGAVAAKALTWMPIVNAALFPLSIIDAGLDGHQLYETRNARKDILANITVTDLTKSLEYVKDNHASLSKTLVLSKKTEINEKAQEILTRLTSSEDKKEVQAEAEQFVKILRRRIHTKYNLEFAGVISKVAAVGIAGAALVVPANFVAWGLAAASAVASGGIFVAGQVLLNKDPFSPPKDVWYAKMAEKVRLFAGRVTDGIERLSLKVSTAFNAMMARRQGVSQN